MKRKPVMFQHCLTCSADDFVINSTENSIAKTLIDMGYDVWFGNNRGNKYSIRHNSIDINSKEYWDYSFDEMGTKDIPAMVQKIIGTTGFEKITYFGHSQGTTQMFVALSDDSTYEQINRQIDTFFALAPIVYIPNQDSKTVKIIAALKKPLVKVASAIHLHSILPGQCTTDTKMAWLKQKFCKKFQSVCSVFVKTADKDATKYDALDKLHEFLQFAPSGTSFKSFIHFGQLVSEDKLNPIFRKYNYGSNKKNKEKYCPSMDLEDSKQVCKVPEYDLRRVKVPVRALACHFDRFGVP